MTTPNIDNSDIFTIAFSKGVTKYNNPTLVSPDKLGTYPFGKVLKGELKGIKGHDVQNHNIKMFTPEKNLTRPLRKAKGINNLEMFMSNKGSEKLPKLSVLHQYKIYKEDQLLSNPGGDNFFLNRSSGVIDNNYDHSKFTKRVGKDLADAGSNLVNAVKDLGLGAKIKYVDNHGKIKEGRKVGFLKTLGNFFKNAASGITLGAYTPEGETKPHGGIGRVKHFFRKIFKDAILDDVVMGVPRSMIHVGEDLMLAGLNSIEVIPDATIGNFKGGRKATTKIFDNAQVALDFATDIMPGGEASGRARSFKLAKGLKGLPIINNITTSDKEISDPNWKFVRNTNFRKVIETISSLIPFRI